MALFPTTRLPVADSDGVSLYYEVQGAGDPVIFCHGIPTDYRAWKNQLEVFSKSFKAISYSRRYASPNDRKGDVIDSTVENNAADLKGLIEKLGVGSVHLVGHSYGGFISAYLAANHPDLIRSLVLVEPAISTLLVEDEDSPLQMLSLLLRSPSVALSARRFQNKSLRPSFRALDNGEQEKAAKLNYDGVQDDEGAYASASDELRQMLLANARTIGELRTEFPPFRPYVGKVKCRTLVINGQQSALWLRRIGKLTSDSIQGCETLSVPNARHFPHIENPALFNERVLGFISKGR